MAVMPTATLAATSTAASIEDKQRQATEAQAKLDALQANLDKQLAELDRLNALLDEARHQVDLSNSKLAALDASATALTGQLGNRAVQMYKAGGLNTLEIIFGTKSLSDLVSRIEFILAIQQQDNQLLADLRKSRSETAYLKQQQEEQLAKIAALQQQADASRVKIEASVSQQQAILNSLTSDIAKLVRQMQQEAQAAAAAAAAKAAAEAAAKAAAEAAAAAAAAGSGQSGSGSTPSGPFVPETVISDAVFLNTGSMSVQGIQAFLNQQPGALKSYSAPDYNGVTKTAAQIIADAANAWGVSPKVILVTLQKEQSLLGTTNPSQYAYDWAMGCGKTDSTTYDFYQGFGNQVYYGAKTLSRNRSTWQQGVALVIDGVLVYPTNASTFTQYRYTPHFGGVSSFWRLYWYYFGNPVG